MRLVLNFRAGVLSRRESRLKRPRSRSPHSRDEDDDQCLQEIPVGENSMRRTGRSRKTKMPEAFEIDAL